MTETEYKEKLHKAYTFANDSTEGIARQALMELGLSINGLTLIPYGLDMEVPEYAETYLMVEGNDSVYYWIVPENIKHIT